MVKSVSGEALGLHEGVHWRLALLRTGPEFVHSSIQSQIRTQIGKLAFPNPFLLSLATYTDAEHVLPLHAAHEGILGSARTGCQGTW
jgi:hypothetical protein